MGGFVHLNTNKSLFAAYFIDNGPNIVIKIMRVIPGFLLFVLGSAAITAERIDSLPEVLAEHQKALGKPLQSVQVDLKIEEANYKLNARYIASRDGSMRIDVYADGERVFSEGLNQDGAWQWPGGADDAISVSKAGEQALRRGVIANLYGLHERPQFGYELQYKGVEDHDDGQYWKILSVDPEGFLETFYINTRTGLIDRKAEQSALHPDIDATEVHSMTYFSDYRWVGKTRMSFAAEKHDVESGDVMQRTTLTDVAVNPELPSAAFRVALN